MRSARGLFLCILSGLLLILAFPRSNYWILAWVGFVPLFLAIEKKSKTKAFLLCYFAGVIFWLGTIYWLVHVTLPGMILLVLYLALYFGLFGLIIAGLGLRIQSLGFLVIPAIWVLLEYTRSHLLTGFPWALLGYSQYLNLPAIQIVDITGAWGVSFLIMMVNILIYRVIKIAMSKDLPPSQPNRGRDPACSFGTLGGKISKIEKINIIFAILILIFSFSYGYYRINGQRANGQTEKTIRISVIQGNIPQELKWEPSAREFIMDKYLTLSAEAIRVRPDFIIWPEAAVPVPLEESSDYYERLISFVKETNIPILLGAVTARDNLYYNSALLLSEDPGAIKKYDKLHLVPFGEYIPLRNLLRFLETVVPIGDFAPGERYTLFKIPGFPLPGPGSFAVLICFEDIFPELAQRFVREGAGLLVNITNDAWFKQTSSPYQHLSASVFRAVENRVFLVRAANTGISGFIQPDGMIISRVQDKAGREIFVEGYKTDEITPLKKATTFYTRFGDIFILVCIFVFFYATILRFL